MSHPATKDEAAAYAINAIADALKLIAVGGYIQAQGTLRSAIGHLDHAETLDLTAALEASLETCACGHVHAAHKDSRCKRCSCLHFETTHSSA